MSLTHSTAFFFQPQPVVVAPGKKKQRAYPVDLFPPLLMILHSVLDTGIYSSFCDHTYTVPGSRWSVEGDREGKS